MKEFQFKKSFEEIKVNGRIYAIDLADEKLKEYQKVFVKFQEDAQLIEEESKTAKTPEEQDKFFEKSKQVLTEVVDTLIGEGSFIQLYNESGRSIMNMLELAGFLVNVIGEKTKNVRENAVNRYVKKPNNQKFNKQR